jgi:hypothetical protein
MDREFCRTSRWENYGALHQLRVGGPPPKLDSHKMSERFTIRVATPEDVEAIAEHRARMFREMGEVSPDTFEILRANEMRLADN